MDWFHEETNYAKRIFEAYDLENAISVKDNDFFKQIEKEEGVDNLDAFFDLKDRSVYIRYSSACRIGHEYLQNRNDSECTKLGILILATHEASHICDEYLQKCSVKKYSFEHDRAEVFTFAKGLVLLNALQTKDELFRRCSFDFGKLKSCYTKFSERAFLNRSINNWESYHKEFTELGDDLKGSNS